MSTDRGRREKTAAEEDGYPFWWAVFDWLADSPGNWYSTAMVAQQFDCEPRHVLPALRAAGRRGLIRWRAADLTLVNDRRQWVDEWRAVVGAKLPERTSAWTV